MRIKWIDTAKGIAMLCVILGHMGGITVAGVNLNLVFAFHLPVFFLLSGYTLKKKELTKEYINGKFKGLMIPYIWTCFVVLLMDVVNQCIVYKNASIQNITDIIATDLVRFFFASGTHTTFADVEIGSRIGAIWFLPAMFFAVLIVQFVLNKTEHAILRWGIVGSIALISYITSDFIWFPFSIQSGAFAALLVLAGYYIREYDVLSKLNWKHYSVCVLIFLYAIVTENTKIYYVTNNIPDLILSMAISVASSFLIFKLAMLCEKSKALSFVGENSIYYLATHLIGLEVLYPYFKKVLEIINFPMNYDKWGYFILHVIFCSAVTWCILFVRKKLKNSLPNVKEEKGGRDHTIDVEKGLLIVLMIIGHYSIDRDFRNIIYSFHMVAFVFLSGYFYKQKENVVKSILHTAKGFLIPYAVFCILDFIFKEGSLSKYIFGMSFSKRFLTEVPSVGPVYFILLLFCVRVIYLLVDRFIKKEVYKIAAVFAISYLGFLLGEKGVWLPWSFDCAMYAVVFYMIGHYCRKYEIFKLVKENLIMYFVLASVWVYMIYRGGMEIAIRAYNPYGLGILGAVCATVLLYMLCTYMCEKLPKWIGRFCACLGENTLYILIVHTVFGSRIYMLVEKIFDPGYIYHMVVNIMIQILLGVFVGSGITWLKRRMAR